MGFFDLSPYAPGDVAAVCICSFQRLPRERQKEYDPVEYSGVVVAYLIGATLSEAATERTRQMVADAEATFTYIPEDGSGFTISSMRGAIHSLQYESLEQQWEQMVRNLMPKSAGEGVHGKWTCIFCGRRWEAGTEPDQCPDCGGYLMRGRIATPEEEAEHFPLGKPSAGAGG